MDDQERDRQISELRGMLNMLLVIVQQLQDQMNPKGEEDGTRE